jgi:hypothetical protein
MFQQAGFERYQCERVSRLSFLFCLQFVLSSFRCMVFERGKYNRLVPYYLDCAVHAEDVVLPKGMGQGDKT